MKEFLEKFKFDLQLFAENDDDNDDEGGENNEGNKVDINELMKDPEFKKQYENKMKEQLGKRLKKYEDVDVEEYKRLKEKEEKNEEEKMGEVEKLQKEVDKYKDKANTLETKLEEREKIMAIKEQAIEKGYTPKLAVKLVDMEDVSKDDEGNWLMDTAFEKMVSDFPEVFSSQQEGEGEGEQVEGEGEKNKGVRYQAGSKQKTNEQTPESDYDAGKQRALARHGKQE